MNVHGFTRDPLAGDVTTLDGLFRRAAERHPDALALADPPDRMQTEGTAPRRLTYADADAMVDAIAAGLRGTGLSPGAVIGIRFPNNADGILTFLGILRAGMIAAPLPLLWRRDCVDALARVGAKGLISCGRHRGVDHLQLAMEVAAEIFSIRYVFGFGSDVPDGVIPLDEVTSGLPPEPATGRDPASDIAVITWDTSADGPVPVARSQHELLAAGAAVVGESHIRPNAAILSTIVPSSLAGLASGLMPWLMSGGGLVLHDPFAPDILAAQIADYRCDTLVVPGTVVARLAGAGLFAAGGSLTNILALWRSPERLTLAASWHDRSTVTDILAFGETAVIAGRRGEDGKPLPLPLGPVSAPRMNGELIAETSRNDDGTLGIRGPMVPHGKDAGIGGSLVASDGMVNTGYTCRHIRETNSLVVTGAPAGLVGVGGYRFAMRALQELVSGMGQDSTLAALPDALTGHRLAGHSPDRAATRDALKASGANALVVRAFHRRARADTT